MKVLQICYKPPLPAADGGTMGMNCITQGLLAGGHQVKLLTVCSDKHPVRLDAIDPEYLSRTAFESVYIDLSIRPMSAAMALLCGESYNVKRFESKAFADKVAQILSDDTFDIVHVDGIFLAPYLPVIRSHSKAPVVLRAHNVEYLIWRKLALSTKQPLKRWYLKKLSLALRSYELEHVNLFDGVVCVTNVDADIFRREGCRKPIFVRPFGIDPIATPAVDVEPFSLFHIGAMDWQPNVDAVNWFLADVWPALHEAVPQARLYLAGRRMPEALLNLRIDGVTVVGEVPDASLFVASKQINIVPLLAGSGIRVKIIEAMELAKTVVATHTAAEGIDYTDGKDILIADTPQQFVEKVRYCFDNPDAAASIGRNAHRLVRDRYDNNTLSEQMIDFYNKIIIQTLSSQNALSDEH